MSRPVLARTAELLETAGGPRIFALLFVMIAAVHAASAQDPPYWDALMGAFAQGHWLATESFSPLDLLRDAAAFNDGGACVYPFSAYPWIVGVLESSGLAPSTRFLVLHLVSFASAAAVVATLFLLVRDAAGSRIAALVALALLAQPMFRALACQMNMDMPLSACTLLSIRSLVRGRFGAASVWALAALLVKPTAIILIAANLAALGLRIVRPAWFRAREPDAGDAQFAAAKERGAEHDGNDRARRRGLLVAFAAHVGLFAVFAAEMLVSAHFGKSVPGVSLFGGTREFLFWRLWTLPEFALALALFWMVAPWITVRALRGQAQSREIDLALFLAAFTGFYCQYENVLPRYFLQAWPALLALLVPAALALGLSRRLVGAALLAFAAFGVVNSDGRFHPTRFADWSEPGRAAPLVTNDGWLLERSLEFRDGLALDQELAERLEARREEVVVAGWPLLHALAIPQMGYLVAPPHLASAGIPIDYAPQPIEPAGALAPGTPAVRVVVPNVFDDEWSRILPGDEVLEVIEKGRLRAFLVRRPADSSDGRR